MLRLGRTLSLAFFLGAFTLTGAPLMAHVGLRAPNGGEILDVGSVTMIRWQVVQEHDTMAWDLYYRTKPTDQWIPIALGLPPGDITTGATHEYPWTVPADVSDQCEVRVVQENGLSQDWDDISDAPFEIRTLRLDLSPTRIHEGETMNVEFAASSLPNAMAALILVEHNAVATFLVVSTGQLNALGHWGFQEVCPDGFQANNMVFRCLVLEESTGIIRSNDVLVELR